MSALSIYEIIEFLRSEGMPYSRDDIYVLGVRRVLMSCGVTDKFSDDELVLLQDELLSLAYKQEHIAVLQALSEPYDELREGKL